MMKKPNRHTEIFFSSFIDDLNNSPDLVSETLKENNIDEKAISEKANQLAGRLLAQVKIRLAKETNRNLLKRAMELLNNAKVDLSNLNPTEKLFNVLRGDQLNASFTFNSLKDFSNEDVLQMLSEMELLKLIEELENKK